MESRSNYEEEYENEITDLLGQLQRTLDARQQAMSLSSLRRTFKRIHDLRATLGEEVNSRASVNGLPNELIVEIFTRVLPEVETCATFDPEDSETSRVQTRPLLWLTHVCRRWRRAALGHPALWQRIDCHHPEQLKEFALHRSYPSQFSLSIDMPRYHKSDGQDALRSVLIDSGRLRRLDITYGGLITEPVLHYELLDLRCPDLECLTVNGCPPMPTATGPPAIVSRRSLFCGGLSRLRALAISPIPDWLPANPLPALTHLYLSFHWYTDLRMSSILSFLGSAPALQVLHLSQFVLPHEDDQPDAVYASVPLSRLKYILFSNKSYLRPCLALLTQLVIPGSARTYLYCVNVNSNDPTSVLPPLPSTAETGSLAVHTDYDGLKVAAQGRDSGFWLYARHSPDTVPDGFATWLAHLPVMFPLWCLSYLQLRIRRPGSAVVRVLREAKALRTLELGLCLYLDDHFRSNSEDYDDMRPPKFDGSKDSLLLLSRALSEATARGDVGLVPCTCPELRVMTISLDSSSLTPWVFYAHWLDAIRSMVLARSRMGRPIRRLAVQPIDLIPEGVETYDDRSEFIDEVHADYALLAGDVEEFVLLPSGECEESIALPTPGKDWDEVERYWTVADNDRPCFSKY